MLVSDLVAATKLHKAFLGPVLVLLGYPVQLFLRFAGESAAESPTELPVTTLLQLPVFHFHVLFPQVLVRVVRFLAYKLPLARVGPALDQRRFAAGRPSNRRLRPPHCTSNNACRAVVSGAL
jgi:hypothetical protein